MNLNRKQGKDLQFRLNNYFFLQPKGPHQILFLFYGQKKLCFEKSEYIVEKDKNYISFMISN